MEGAVPTIAVWTDVLWAHLAARLSFRVAHVTEQMIALADQGLLFPKNTAQTSKCLTTAQTMCLHCETRTQANQSISTQVCRNCGIRVSVRGAVPVTPKTPWSTAGRTVCRDLLRARPLPMMVVRSRPRRIAPGRGRHVATPVVPDPRRGRSLPMCARTPARAQHSRLDAVTPHTFQENICQINLPIL